ncbi:uncharacterized protein TNCT_444591 [Trichonephila clavata]|uniref:Uncharacterized protein n=1 Tax=Trichonephila clavata TaxID=2740835 RepID=A0A8X6GE76_TRICU|nr:uncharacterized protein TNCT_444591 [Trichonephila clavata]
MFLLSSVIVLSLSPNRVLLSLSGMSCNVLPQSEFHQLSPLRSCGPLWKCSSVNFEKQKFVKCQEVQIHIVNYEKKFVKRQEEERRSVNHKREKPVEKKREGQVVNRRVNLKDLVPKFDAKNADLICFLKFSRGKPKKEKVSDDRWVSQLISLLPVESTELVAKEPPERRDDYSHIKKLLLNRFQLTPVALRDRFESHQRKPGTLWSDLVFDLRSYLENWLAGMGIVDLCEWVERIISDQTIKKESPH